MDAASRGVKRATGIALLAVASLAATAALRVPTSFHFPLFGDGHYYFLQTHSLLEDGDLDLENQLALFGDPLAAHVRVTRGLGNSLLWAPFYAVGRIWGTLASDDPSRIALHAAWGCRAGTLFYLLAALRLLLGWSPVARQPSWLRALVLAGLVAGTPLFGHTFKLPLYNHVLTLFVVAALLRAGDALELAPLRAAAALGAALGLALTTRPELTLFVLPAVTQARALGLPRAARVALVSAACAAPALLAALLLFRQSGTSALPPPGFMDLLHPRWLELGFSPRNGLFAQQPLLWLALLGVLPCLWTPSLASYALVLSALLFAWVQASVWDVWGGFGFGARRMIPVLPVAYLALCELAGRARARFGTRVATAVLAPLFGWATFHGYAALDVERAAAIDGGDAIPESPYEQNIGIATSLPLLIPRALQVGASLESAYRIAGRAALPDSLVRSGRAIDRVTLLDERGRDFALGPRSWVFPLQRMPLCALALPASAPASMTVSLDGRRLASTLAAQDYRVHALPEPISARWIRLDLGDGPIPAEVLLDGRCRVALVSQIKSARTDHGIGQLRGHQRASDFVQRPAVELRPRSVRVTQDRDARDDRLAAVVSEQHERFALRVFQRLHP
jgi:hypothetical protein